MIPVVKGIMVCALLIGAPSFKTTASDDPFADLEPMGRDELSESTGGFRVGAFDIGFGLSISSLVDGTKIAETHLTLAQDGQFIPVMPSQLQAMNAGAPIVVGGGEKVVITDQGISLEQQVAGRIDELPSLDALPIGTRIIENTRDGVEITQSVQMTIVMENMRGIADAGRFSLRVSDIAKATALINSGSR